MENWINNFNENGIPIIMRAIHIGDFVEFLYEESALKLHGGFVTTLSSDSPETDKGHNKIFILGLSTTHPNHSEEEKIFWASKIKNFRVIHK